MPNDRDDDLIYDGVTKLEKMIRVSWTAKIIYMKLWFAIWCRPPISSKLTFDSRLKMWINQDMYSPFHIYIYIYKKKDASDIISSKKFHKEIY